MELDIRHAEDTAADVRATGALDLSTAAKLYAALDELRDSGTRSIRLDVSAIDFVDSPGLATLLRFQDEARGRGQHFSVHGARGLVRRVLRETGTAELLEA